MTVHPIETLWRQCGLPEYFLGNGGTNTKLYALYDAIRAAQPEYLSGCLHPRDCQRLGMCQSQSCKHAGKVIVKRVCVELKESGILYPGIENAGGDPRT
jgi:hypothetical protein